MSQQIIVLGWDALDAELVHEFGLADAFGGHVSKIDTYANPVIDEPHTRELWPSMITGLHPDDHGIHAVTDEEGVDWDSDLISVAARVAGAVGIPQSVRTAIGKRLRERGAGLDQRGVSYYSRESIPTVFDGGGRAISIPNYQTPEDARLGLDATRDDVWGAILPDRDGCQGFEPAVSPGELRQTLAGQAGRRLGHTLQAVRAGEPLTWCWWGLLDTVGHVDPAVPDDLQRWGYELAADVTETIRRAAPDDAIVVSVSDHGLQAGDHTDYATVAGDAWPAAEISHVFELAAWVDGATDGQSPETRTFESAELSEVSQRLEQLGYLA